MSIGLRCILVTMHNNFLQKIIVSINFARFVPDVPENFATLRILQVFFGIPLIIVAESGNLTQWRPSDLIHKNYYTNYLLAIKQPKVLEVFVWDEARKNFYSLVNEPFMPLRPNRQELSGKVMELFVLENIPGVPTFDRQQKRVDISELFGFELDAIHLFVDYFNVT